jgi:hypothetical protein
MITANNQERIVLDPITHPFSISTISQCSASGAR